MCHSFFVLHLYCKSIVQKAIADIFTAYNTRKLINERLKAQIKDLCPILVKGAVEEGERE